MTLTVFSVITFSLYCAAASLQALRLVGRLNSCKPGLLVFGFTAVLLHAYLLHRWVDVANGQNLSLFNLLSTLMWLVAVISLLLVLLKPIESLAVVIFPLAAVSIILVLLFPSAYIVRTSHNLQQLAHILLSILAVSVAGLAAIQALMVALQDYCLQRKKAVKLLARLPALQTMETLLGQLTFAGFMLLSLLFATALMTYREVFSTALLEKFILTICAWIEFFILVLGRLLFGWRGRVATIGTLSAFAILLVVYLGSRYFLLS